MALILTVALEDQRTVNAQWYTQVFMEACSWQSQCNIILHHDNGILHTERETKQVLEESKVKLLEHSPDRSPYFNPPKIRCMVCSFGATYVFNKITYQI